MFADIHAYVVSLRAPKYPFAIDEVKAQAGAAVFAANCAGCHGTYAEDGADDTYPNLLIPLAAIGTDPVVANGEVIHSPHLVEWYNNSFYGQVTPFYPVDPDMEWLATSHHRSMGFGPPAHSAQRLCAKLKTGARQ